MDVIKVLKSVIAILAPQLVKEDSKEGIKETKELMIGLNSLSLYLIGKFQDGVQFTDFTELWSHMKDDAGFKKALEDAYDGYNLIPAEVKDIDNGEGLELIGVQLDFIPALKESIKEYKEAKKAKDSES